MTRRQCKLDSETSSLVHAIDHELYTAGLYEKLSSSLNEKMQGTEWEILVRALVMAQIDRACYAVDFDQILSQVEQQAEGYCGNCFTDDKEKLTVV